jgi:hypothetical protein
MSSGNAVGGATSPMWRAGPCARLIRDWSVASEALRRSDAIVGLCACSRTNRFLRGGRTCHAREVSRSLSFGLDSLGLRREREQTVRAQHEPTTAGHRRRNTSAIWLTDRRTLPAREPAAPMVQAPPSNCCSRGALQSRGRGEVAARDRQVLETGRGDFTGESFYRR